MLRVVLSVFSVLFGFVSAATPVSAATLGLTRIVDGPSIAAPIHAAAPPGDSERLFILGRGGDISVYDRTTGGLSPLYAGPSDVSQAGERGAYAIAFDQDFASNGQLYLSYVTTGDVHRVVEIDTLASDVDAAPLREILAIQHPDDGTGNHYGGWLGTDTDGNLILTTGDSGSRVVNDPNNPLLAKVLRIDPETGDTEVIGDGLRNPYRAGYDAATDTLIIADVGEGRREEINLGTDGANYGWPAFEGTLPFAASAFPDGTVFTDPIFEYDHETDPIQGRSVTGGEIYRGDVTELDGQYFFGDFFSDQVFSFAIEGGEAGPLTVWDLDIDVGDIAALSSFGLDGDGNLYLLDLTGEVFLVTSAEGFVTSTPVPLPASVWLLAGALALLGAQRRKAPTSSKCADQRN
ncbi:MAG: PQQ-dependent sugar dehydrogenase [Pseudomonadota bacterium]